MPNAYVKASVVKNFLKSRPDKMRIGEEGINALDNKIQAVIDLAIQRALAANRITLKESDFA